MPDVHEAVKQGKAAAADVTAASDGLAIRVTALERQVAILRKALRPYYDIDDRGFVS